MTLRNRFLAAAAASIAGIAGLVALDATPAQAAQCNWVGNTNYIRCVTNNGHGRYDYMTFHHNDRVVAKIHVLCTGGGGYKWDATWTRNIFTRTNADLAAKNWCSGY